MIDGSCHRRLNGGLNNHQARPRELESQSLYYVTKREMLANFARTERPVTGALGRERTFHSALTR